VLEHTVQLVGLAGGQAQRAVAILQIRGKNARSGTKKVRCASTTRL
jgi:hypothetical protein